MSSVSISILISVVGWDGLAPCCTALEVYVIDIGSSIDDIDINTLTSISGIQVLAEVAESQALSV